MEEPLPPPWAARLAASMEEDASVPNLGFFLVMLRLRAPLSGKRGTNRKVPPRRPPSVPDPLCALVLPLVRSVPAETGDALSPPAPFQRDLYDRVSPLRPRGLKRYLWNQNCIQMVHLNREAGA
ncbi:hypothetical protein CapIbe_003314 [Capra ibex]